MTTGKPAVARSPRRVVPEAGAREVIVVDLDGTLVHTDTLDEKAVRLLFKAPRAVPGAVFAIFKGRAAFKAYHSDHITLNPETLNYSPAFLAYLRERADEGAYLVLCTAANIRVAETVGAHLGIFDEVIGSDGKTNLKGSAKAKLLKERFPQGFVYAGDSSADLAVWDVAKGAILVGATDSVAQRVRNLGRPIVEEFSHRSDTNWDRAKLWARALRVHHWSKNVLIFVPLMLAHLWSNAGAVLSTITAFLLLLAVTSSTYLINDLSDLDADRRHATKRFRPIASGAISIRQAMAVALVTIPVALIAAAVLNLGFAASLLVYLVVTLAYSFGLKRIPLFDTFLIAVLFTSRMVMGTTLLNQPLPQWLLVFSMFFFFSLAMAKRHTEVVKAADGNTAGIAARGYETTDAPLTLSIGMASGLASVLIMVLYLIEEAFSKVPYARPELLWVVVLSLAVWIGRIWLLTHRGQMNDDPVSFALRDRASQGLAVIVALAFVGAL